MIVNSCLPRVFSGFVFSSSLSHSSVGRRGFHSFSILILFVFRSYLMIFFSSRNSENSVSFLDEIFRVSDSSFMLCHSPSLRIAKNLLSFNLILFFVIVCSYFSLVERVIVFVEVLI